MKPNDEVPLWLRELSEHLLSATELVNSLRQEDANHNDNSTEPADDDDTSGAVKYDLPSYISISKVDDVSICLETLVLNHFNTVAILKRLFWIGRLLVVVIA